MPRRPAHAAFLDLLERQRGALYRIADAYAPNAEARDDLIQEIVLQLWRAFPSYDSERPFAAWMKRVAFNVAISWVRRAYRQPRIEIDGDSILELPAASRRDDSEDVGRLRAAITQLGELDRALLLLHLEDHSHEEVAAVLGITSSNVATRLHRIKQRLRQQWRETQESTP